MFFEDFNSRYKTVPVISIAKDYKKGSAKKDFSTLSHMHKEMEILLVLSGKGKFYVDSKEYEIFSGDLILVAPYQIHYATVLADEDYKRCCLCFDLDILYDKELKKGFENGTLLVKNKISNNPFYSKLIKDAYDSIHQSNSGWELKVIGLLSQFFGKLKEDGLICENNTFDGKNTTCRTVLDYISKNFEKEISSNTVAKALHINNSYFCRVFKKNFGFSFQDYLCKYRIEKAKNLIKNTDASISQISESVGFNSFSYFSKCFKECTLLTPTQYRKRQSNSN